MSASRRRMRQEEKHWCPVYHPFLSAYNAWDRETGLVQGIRSRSDVDYVRELVAFHPQEADKNLWSPNGWCEMPLVDLFVSFF
jgi:mannosidase alpha-like ER degradation enhancer 1